MIEKISIISLIVLAIHYSMKNGEIFEFISDWIGSKVYAHHPKLIQPLYDCPICMTPWYGSALYWLIGWDGLWITSVREWPVIIIAAMGLTYVLNYIMNGD